MQESAVHGTGVTFGLSCRVNDSHQTTSKFLQDHTLCRRFWLAHLFSLLGLRKQALTGRVSHLLGYKGKWQSEMEIKTLTVVISNLHHMHDLQNSLWSTEKSEAEGSPLDSPYSNTYIYLDMLSNKENVAYLSIFPVLRSMNPII